LNAIEIKDLNFSYGQSHIIRNVNLTLPQNEFLTIIGPNGGGKTTLLKLLLGILKPDSGNVKLLGENVDRISKKVGYVPQNTQTQAGFPITVKETALMGRLKLKGRFAKAGKKDYEAADQIFETLNITEIKNNKLSDISGGQRQRVLLARAILCEPELLLLDEPSSSLDSIGQSIVYSTLKELNKRMTIVVVSHDLSLISGFSTCVACINKTLHFHNEPNITPEMLSDAYGDIKESCPVELIAHGIPHRVLTPHEHDNHCDCSHHGEENNG